MALKKRKLSRKKSLNEQFRIHHRKRYHSFKRKRGLKFSSCNVKQIHNGSLSERISRKSQLQLNLTNKACDTADCGKNEAIEPCNQYVFQQMIEVLQCTPGPMTCMDCLLHKFCGRINRQQDLRKPTHLVFIRKCIKKAFGNNIATTEKCLGCRLRRQSDLQTSVRPLVERVKVTNTILCSVSEMSFEDSCPTPTSHVQSNCAQFVIYRPEHLKLIYIDFFPKISTALAVPWISSKIFLLKMIDLSQISNCPEYLTSFFLDMYNSTKDMIGDPEINPSLNLSQGYLYTNYSEGNPTVVPTKEEPQVLPEIPAMIHTEEEPEALSEKPTVVQTEGEPEVLPAKPTVVPTKGKSTVVPAKKEPEALPEKLAVVLMESEPESLPEKPSLIFTKIKSALIPKNPPLLIAETEPTVESQKPALVLKEKAIVFLPKTPAVILKETVVTILPKTSTLVLKETVITVIPNTPAVVLTKITVAVCLGSSGVVITNTLPVVQTISFQTVTKSLPLGLHGTKYINDGQSTTSNPCKLHGYSIRKGEFDFMFDIHLQNHTDIVVSPANQSCPQTSSPVQANTLNEQALTMDKDQPKGPGTVVHEDLAQQKTVSSETQDESKSDTNPQTSALTLPFVGMTPTEKHRKSESMETSHTVPFGEARNQSTYVSSTETLRLIQEATQSQASLPIPSIRMNISDIQEQRLLEIGPNHCSTDTRHECNDNTLNKGDFSTKHHKADGAVDGLLPSGCDANTATDYQDLCQFSDCDRTLLLKHSGLSYEVSEQESGTDNDKQSVAITQPAEDTKLISHLNENSQSKNPTNKLGKLLKSTTRLKMTKEYESQGKPPDCLHEEKGTQSQSNLNRVQSRGSENTMPPDYSQSPPDLTSDIGQSSDNRVTPDDSQSHSNLTSGSGQHSDNIVIPDDSGADNIVMPDDSSLDNIVTPDDSLSPQDVTSNAGQIAKSTLPPNDSQSPPDLTSGIEQSSENTVTPEHDDSQNPPNLTSNAGQFSEYRETPYDSQSQSNFIIITIGSDQASGNTLTPDHTQNHLNPTSGSDQGSETTMTSDDFQSPPDLAKDAGQGSEYRVTPSDSQSHSNLSIGSDQASENTVCPDGPQSTPDLTKDAGKSLESTMTPGDYQRHSNPTSGSGQGSDNIVTPDDFGSDNIVTPDDFGSDNIVTPDYSQSPPNLTVGTQRHDALQAKETSERQNPSNRHGIPHIQQEQWPSLESFSITNNNETEGIQFRSADSDIASETRPKEIWQDKNEDSVDLYHNDHEATPFSNAIGATKVFSCDPLSSNFALFVGDPTSDHEENQETQPKRCCFSPFDQQQPMLEDNFTHHLSSNQCGNEQSQGKNKETQEDTSVLRRYQNYQINTGSTFLDEQQDTRNQIVIRDSQVLPETRQQNVIRDHHFLPPSSREMTVQPINNANDLGEQIPRVSSRITAEPNALISTDPNRVDYFQYLGNVMEGQTLINLQPSHPLAGAAQQHDTRFDNRGSTQVTVTICHRQRPVTVLTFPTPVNIGHLIQVIEHDDNVQEVLRIYPGPRRLEWEEFLTRENVGIIYHNTTVELVLH